MATLTGSAAAAISPAIYQVNGTISRIVRYSIAASASVGDVVQMVKVPAGAIIAAVQFGIDGHTGVLTVNVGDGNDASAYAAAAVLSGSAVALTSIPVRGMGRSYSAEDTIDISIAGVSAPVAAGTLVLRVDYTVQNG
jgi:hypothetical protein